MHSSYKMPTDRTTDEEEMVILEKKINLMNSKILDPTGGAVC